MADVAVWMQQLARGELPAELAAQPKLLLEVLAPWWREQAKQSSLDTPQVELVRRLVGLPLDRASIALVVDLIAAWPKDLTYRLSPVLEAAVQLGGAFVAELRARIVPKKLPARPLVVEWLIAHDGLTRDDARILLASRDSRIHDALIGWLERLPDATLVELAEPLAVAVATEKRQHVRRPLADLAERANANVADSTTKLANEIPIAWDLGGARPRARTLLRQLATERGSEGLLEVLRLARRASARTLRREVGTLIDELRADPAYDEALDAACAAAAASGDRADGTLRDHRLEKLMIEQRPVRARTLRDLLAGKRKYGIVVEGETGRALATREALDRDGVVRVVHPASCTEADVARWLGEIRAGALAQPIRQLDRPVFRVASHQVDDTTYLLDPAGPRYAWRMWARDWAPDREEIENDGDWDAMCTASRRTLGEWTAIWEHAPTPVAGPDGDREGAPEDAAEAVYFVNATTRRLGDVPPIVFSEVILELTPDAAPRVGAANPRIAPAPMVRRRRPG